eukprot:SAG31_NODE_31594_length_366_cov_0.842697_2_plen_71_part_01
MLLFCFPFLMLLSLLFRAHVFLWRPGRTNQGDTFACRESALAARLSAGAVVDATLAVAEGRAATGLAIVRP